MHRKSHFNVFPSLSNKVAIKNRLAAAARGYHLLKLKLDAMKLKLREAVRNRAILAEEFDQIFSDAIFSIAKAHYLRTDFKPALIIGSERADCWIEASVFWVLGLMLPQYEACVQKPMSVPLTGLAHGGRQVQLIRDKFQEVFKKIVLVSSCDYSIKALNRAIRAVSMRLNGLQHVTIPRLQATLRYILDELEEEDREDFFHVKVALRRSTMFKVRHQPGSFRPNVASSEQSLEGTSSADGIKSDDDAMSGRKTEAEEPFVRLPLMLLMKQKAANAAQTLITGHYPGSREFISPTDSLISGNPPRIEKRSAFTGHPMTVLLPRRDMLPKSLQWKDESEESAATSTDSCVSLQTLKGEEDLETSNACDFSSELMELSSCDTLVPDFFQSHAESILNSFDCKPVTSVRFTSEPKTSCTQIDPITCEYKSNPSVHFQLGPPHDVGVVHAKKSSTQIDPSTCEYKSTPSVQFRPHDVSVDRVRKSQTKIDRNTSQCKTIPSVKFQLSSSHEISENHFKDSNTHIDPSTSQNELKRRKVCKSEMSVQTDVTGCFPQTSEIDLTASNQVNNYECDSLKMHKKDVSQNTSDSEEEEK